MKDVKLCDEFGLWKPFPAKHEIPCPSVEEGEALLTKLRIRAEGFRPKNALDKFRRRATVLMEKDFDHMLSGIDIGTSFSHITVKSGTDIGNSLSNITVKSEQLSKQSSGKSITLN